MHAPPSLHRVVCRPRVAAAALVVSVVMTSLAGCGESDPGPTAGSDLQEQLRDLPGVRDAAAGEVTIEQDTTGSRAVVDMAADAGDEELERVVAALTAADVRESAIYQDAGTVDYDTGVRAPAVFAVSARTAPASIVELLGAGRELVSDVPEAVVTVYADPEGESEVPEPSLRLDVGDVDPDELAELAAQAQDDDALGVARLTLEGGPEDLPPGVSASSLTVGPGGLTGEVVDTWRQLVAAVDAAPVEALPSYDAERALVDVYLVVEDGVVAADVTPTSYDGDLQPVVGDLLDAVAAGPRGTSLSVWAARDYVLQVEGGEVVGRVRPGSWQAFAAERLADTGR